MKRAGKGPQNYAQWTEALEMPLTVRHAEYLRRGTFRQKKLYAPLFNRISDYVTDTFNSAVKKIGGQTDTVTAVYELTVFSSLLKRLFFFKDLDFIAQCDKDALSVSLKDAALAVTGSFDAENNELAFALGIIKRTVSEGAK